MSRLVVVGGGGSGIGRASARWFAAQGDTVWVIGRRSAPLGETVEQLGLGSRAIVADLGSAEGAECVRRQLDGRTVDVVVAAAGGTRALVPTALDEIEREWIADLSQNLMSAVLLVEAVRPLLARPGGRIIGLGSIGAQLGSGYGGSYGASKAALHAWMYWLAADLGPQGVTANLVLPGYVPDTGFFGERVTPEFHAVRVARALVGRAGTSDEVAAAIGFLASADAGYVTGQLLGVNGGMVFGR